MPRQDSEKVRIEKYQHSHRKMIKTGITEKIIFIRWNHKNRTHETHNPEFLLIVQKAERQKGRKTVKSRLEYFPHGI